MSRWEAAGSFLKRMKVTDSPVLQTNIVRFKTWRCPLEIWFSIQVGQCMFERFFWTKNTTGHREIHFYLQINFYYSSSFKLLWSLRAWSPGLCHFGGTHRLASTHESLQQDPGNAGSPMPTSTGFLCCGDTQGRLTHCGGLASYTHGTMLCWPVTRSINGCNLWLLKTSMYSSSVLRIAGDSYCIQASLVGFLDISSNNVFLKA